MAFDWTGNDGTEAIRLPLGMEHDVTITKVVFGSDRKGPFRSQNNDPQIMLVLSDAQARECAAMITLSDKAAWLLKGILSASGANLEGMNKAGITPRSFANPQWGSRNLVGRSLRIRVKAYKDDNGNLAEIAPLRRPVSQTPPQPAQPTNAAPASAQAPQQAPSELPPRQAASFPSSRRWTTNRCPMIFRSKEPVI